MPSDEYEFIAQLVDQIDQQARSVYSIANELRRDRMLPPRIAGLVSDILRDIASIRATIEHERVKRQ